MERMSPGAGEEFQSPISTQDLGGEVSNSTELEQAEKLPPGKIFIGVRRRADGTLDFSRALVRDKEPEESPTGPEKIYSNELFTFLDAADHLAELSRVRPPGLRESEGDENAESARDFDLIGKTIFEIISEDIHTPDKAIEYLEAKEKKYIELAKHYHGSKTIARQLSRIQDTLEFVREMLDGRSDYLQAAKDKSFKEASESFRESGELKRSIRSGELNFEDALRTIDRLYYLESKAPKNRSVETRFSLLVSKMEELKREGGAEAVFELLEPYFNKFKKENGESVTVQDMVEGSELVFVTSKIAGELVGSTVERPVVLFNSNELGATIMGSHLAGFMSPKGLRHALNGTGLEDLPVIVAYNDPATMNHEILHSTDFKSINQQRLGFGRVLEEFLAFLGESSNDISRSGQLPAGWAGSSKIEGGSRIFSEKIYYDRYYKQASPPSKITYDEYCQLVEGISVRIEELFKKTDELKPILRLLAISGHPEEFLDLSEGVLKSA